MCPTGVQRGRVHDAAGKPRCIDWTILLRGDMSENSYHVRTEPTKATMKPAGIELHDTAQASVLTP